MSQILLYYPSINLPDENWIKKSILYSDKFSTILPFDNINDSRIPDHLKRLYDEEQYYPIFIEKIFDENNNIKNDLETEFIDTLESEDYRKFRDQKMLKSNVKDSLIYKNKFTDKIISYLKDNGLLEDSGMNSIFVDSMASIMYLSKLSKFISYHSKDNIIPCTDDEIFQYICVQLSKKERALNFTLSEGLFVPEATSIRELVKFKKKRSDQLLRFTRWLNKLPEQFLNNQDEDFNYIERAINDEIHFQFEVIKKELKSAKINFRMQSLTVLFSGIGIHHISELSILQSLFTVSPILIAPYAQYKKDINEAKTNDLYYLFEIQKMLK